MQEETTPLTDTQQHSVEAISHVFHEVGRELLSKPNLLCDIVESMDAFPILIYCNTPSDTDFAEVMLKKRGISAQKLIGNVPQDKVEKTFEQLKKGELTVIVLTDVAARIIDLTPFKAAINYSVPQDSGSYLERCGEGRAASLNLMITLVTPLELTNFHFLKKGLGFEPKLAEPPSAESIMRSRFSHLRAQALELDAGKDENVKVMTDLVLSDQEKEKIVALLVNNTLNVLPAVRASQAKTESIEEEDDDEGYPQRSDRGERGERGGDRWGNRRGGGRRGGNRDEEYRGRDRHDSDDVYESGESEDRRSSGRSRDRRRSHSHDRRRKKDARIYLGKGAEEGVTRNDIVNVLSENGIDEAGLKHLSIRKNYTFFDIDDEKSPEVIEALKANEENKVSVKAITINAVVEEESQPEGESNNLPLENDDSVWGTDSDDREEENFGNR